MLQSVYCSILTKRGSKESLLARTLAATTGLVAAALITPALAPRLPRTLVTAIALVLHCLGVEGTGHLYQRVSDGSQCTQV